MGTWDINPFGNDTACDWLNRLEEVNDLSLIENTFGTINRMGSNYLEAPEAEEAIAAAETIARLKGCYNIKNNYTEQVDEWVAKHKLEPPEKLVDAAIRAIERILTQPSELLELWEESD